MLHHLLNFWLLQFLMLFAAGSSAITDAGGGGGDGGGVDSGAGNGGAGDDAAGVDESGGGDGGDLGEVDDELGDAGDAGGTDDTGTANADPNAPVDLGDGRQVPAKFKKLFDLAKKAGLEKEAKQLYFANQRLTKAIPGGVNGAIQLAKDLEEMGGIEGVRELQDKLDVYSGDADLFENNQAKWVETGFQKNPEAALKAFAHTLDYVGEHHAEHYDHLMAKVIVNDLGSLDVRGIHQILASAKDNPEAARLAKQLADYWNARLETSQKVPQKKDDKTSKALSDREAAVKKSEMDLRFKQVNQGVFPALKNTVTKTLRAEAKAGAIDLDKLSKDYPAEWRNMLNEIHQEIMRAAIKDQRFLDKHYALVEKNQLKRAEEAVNRKHDELAPEIARRVMATYGVFRGKKANAGRGGDKNQNRGGDNTNANQNAGWQRVSKRPENSAINWAKTTPAMQLDGKYILNDGKKVVVAY